MTKTLNNSITASHSEDNSAMFAQIYNIPTTYSVTDSMKGLPTHLYNEKMERFVLGSYLSTYESNNMIFVKIINGRKEIFNSHDIQYMSGRYSDDFKKIVVNGTMAKVTNMETEKPISSTLDIDFGNAAHMWTGEIFMDGISDIILVHSLMDDVRSIFTQCAITDSTPNNGVFRFFPDYINGKIKFWYMLMEAPTEEVKEDGLTFSFTYTKNEREVCEAIEHLFYSITITDYDSSSGIYYAKVEAFYYKPIAVLSYLDVIPFNLRKKSFTIKTSDFGEDYKTLTFLPYTQTDIALPYEHAISHYNIIDKENKVISMDIPISNAPHVFILMKNAVIDRVLEPEECAVDFEFITSYDGSGRFLLPSNPEFLVTDISLVTMDLLRNQTFLGNYNASVGQLEFEDGIFSQVVKLKFRLLFPNYYNNLLSVDYKGKDVVDFSSSNNSILDDYSIMVQFVKNTIQTTLVDNRDVDRKLLEIADFVISKQLGRVSSCDVIHNSFVEDTKSGMNKQSLDMKYFPINKMKLFEMDEDIEKISKDAYFHKDPNSKSFSDVVSEQGNVFDLNLILNVTQLNIPIVYEQTMTPELTYVRSQIVLQTDVVTEILYVRPKTGTTLNSFLKLVEVQGGEFAIDKINPEFFKDHEGFVTNQKTINIGVSALMFAGENEGIIEVGRVDPKYQIYGDPIEIKLIVADTQNLYSRDEYNTGEYNG